MSHSIILDDRSPYNATSAKSTTATTVTWQSAFWPLITCALAVMLQNTGRVCGGHYRDSYALRSSPLICIVDTLFMITKFFSMIILGCSIRVAARHVWYDRFEYEVDGCRDTFELFRHACKSDTTHQRLEGVSIRADSDEIPALYPCSSASAKMLDKNKWQSQDKSQTQQCAIRAKVDPGDEDTASASTASTIRWNVVVKELENGQEMDLESPCVGPTTIIRPNIQLATYNRGDYDLEMRPASGVSLEDVSTEPCGIYPGSGIDRTWRLNMTGFIFGTLPQAMKVFSMRGIPLTQILVAFFMISFLVTEIFRAIAGPAGAVDLQPMPIISKTKKAFARHQIMGLLASCSAGWLFCYSYLLSDINSIDRFVSIRPLAALVPSPLFGAFLNILVTIAIYLLIRSTLNILRLSMLRDDPSGTRKRRLETKLLKFKAVVYDLIAFDHSLPWGFFLYTVLLPFVITAYEIFMEFWASQGWISLFADSAAVAVFAPLSIPIQLSAYYVIFRLLFMGSLSSYPCWLFAIQGQFSEFVSWALVMLNLLFSFIGYAYHENFSYNTLKPAWAEYLG